MINNKVKQYRVINNITQEHLALAVNITRQSLIAIEKQKFNPSLDLAFRLSKYFGCTIEELFEHTEEDK